MEILDKRKKKGNSTVKFEIKWHKAPRKYSTILVKGENPL